MIILFNITDNCAYNTIIMMHIKYHAYKMRGIVKLSNYLSPLYYNLLYTYIVYRYYIKTQMYS